MNNPIRGAVRARRGFTLVEVLISMVIISIMLLVLVQMTDATNKVWTTTNSRAAEFREARDAYETLTRRLAQATLNTYWDYDSPTAPKKYLRQSELRFISGPATTSLTMPSNPPHPTHAVFFQAPIGYTEKTDYAQLPNLLNTWGYFIEWNSDQDTRPPFLTSANIPLRYRFRMMELMEPSESLTLYTKTSGTAGRTYTGKDWFLNPFNTVKPTRKRMVAENILAIVLLPQLSTVDSSDFTTLVKPGFTYDSSTDGNGASGGLYSSKNQLPPLIRVTMIALDETSFGRYQSNKGTTMPAWPNAKFLQVGSTDSDMAAMTSATTGSSLTAARVKYRSFTSVVPIKGAKWSTN